MANVSLFNDVQVSMESAAATAVAITGINNGATVTVTHAGADPTQGDYVRFTDMQGMTQLQNRVFRVASATSGSFVIEGVGLDSTDYGVFSAGQFEVLTLGTTIDVMRNVNATGGEAAEVDITTIHDAIQQTADGLKSSITFTFDTLWDPTAPGFEALIAADTDGVQRAFLFEFKGGKKYAFNGTVSLNDAPTGGQGEVAVSPGSVRVRGKGTSFAS